MNSKSELCWSSSASLRSQISDAFLHKCCWLKLGSGGGEETERTTTSLSSLTFPASFKCSSSELSLIMITSESDTLRLTHARATHHIHSEGTPRTHQATRVSMARVPD